MTVCSVKFCRNYKGKIFSKRKVTFHLFPTDPVESSRWINIIRKSRQEDYWKPSKSSVVCSDHFHGQDKYFVGRVGRRRIKKGAVPVKALFLSSVKSDESEDSDEDVNLLSQHNNTNDILNESLSFRSSEGNEDKNAVIEIQEGQFNNKTDDPLSDVNMTTGEGPPGIIDAQPSYSETRTGNLNNTPDQKENHEDFSDLDSIFDSPKKAKLRRDLRRKIALQDKHTRQIQSLKRKNMRLKKKNAIFKRIIEQLMKERKK